MKAPFLFCGIYGVFLAILIATHLVGYGALDLFLVRPYVLGTHTEVWMDWHAMGCFFVGLVNLLAARWPDGRPRRDIASASVVIYGVWALLNLRVMFTPMFHPLMWSNVIGCAIAAGWSAIWLSRSATADA